MNDLLDGLTKVVLKILKQITKALLALLLVAALGSICYLVVKKDEILQRTIAVLNQSLTTPVAVDKIDFSLFSNWPNATIVLQGVSTEKPDKFQHALLNAREIRLSVDLLSILAEDYKVNEVVITDAEIALEIANDGTNNFSLFKKNKQDTIANTSTTEIAIRRIALRNSTIHYLDFSRRTPLLARGSTEEIIASTTFSVQEVSLKPSGDLRLLEFDNGDLVLPPNELYDINLVLTYQAVSKQLKINRSTLRHQQFSFENIVGSISLGQQTQLDLSFDLPVCRLQDLKKQIPARFTKSIEQYQLSTNISGSASFRGALNNLRSQQLAITYQLNALQATYPDRQLKLEDHSLSGKYLKESGKTYNQAVIKDLKGDGLIEGHPTDYQFAFISANAKTYSGDLSGTITGPTFQKLISNDAITELQGNFQYSAHVQNLQNEIQADGEVNFTSVSFKSEQSPADVSELQGTVLFNNSELALQDLKGFLGSSDFDFSGIIINPTNMTKESAPYFIEGDLQSKRLLLDEILLESTSQNPLGQSTRNSTVKNYTPGSHINIKLQIAADHIRYKRFNGKNLQGDIQISDSRITTEQVNFQAIGGTVAGNLTVFPEGNFLRSISNFTITDLYADSIFYVFENFDQDFIENKHLSGRITAKTNNQLFLTTNLTPIPKTLKSTIEATISEGRLIDFPPMYRLSTFVEEEQLAELSFSKITNQITIEDGRISIPEMHIESNVSNIELSGWHTLDQQLEYHLKVPLRRKYKRDKDERFGEIEDPEKNISNLFLKITGTTDDYKFSYDKKAVLNKVKEDIKKEGKDLINIFQQKGKKTEDQTSLSDDEYFDFSDSTKVATDTTGVKLMLK